MSWLGRTRLVLDTCGSTNDEAARLAAGGAPHGAVVVARAQRQGRGRLGRTWYSPSGENLYFSCVLRPALAPPEVPPITLAAGLGVVDAVRGLGADAALKWPNDVLLGGRKLAGVLTEMSTRGPRVEHVVVGIGVNLSTRAFPPELATTATSLALAGIDVDAPALTDALVASLEFWLDRFLAGGVAAIADAWLQHAGLADGARRVRASTPRGVIEGRAHGLDAHGRLLVLADDGSRHELVTADALELVP